MEKRERSDEKVTGKGKLENEIREKGQDISEESTENRLRMAACRIVPEGAARERIIEGVKQGKRGRRKMAFRVPAAAFAACLILFLLCFARPGVIGEDVVVYAATEEHGWQKLEEEERILLKMEPYQTLREGETAFDDRGESNYWPYKCNFRVAVSENYLYNQEAVMVRDDHIRADGDRIEWWVAPERTEDAGRVMQGSFRLWIVDDNLHKTAALDLELTKEDGQCYAELKRVWKSGE